jgi:5-methylcytosine-specific restriction protein A
MSNGVLLCTRCHHRVHRDGWEIEVRRGGVAGVNGGGVGVGVGVGVEDEVVWFVPPRLIDPNRTPRAGGRARFGIAA